MPEFPPQHEFPVDHTILRPKPALLSLQADRRRYTGAISGLRHEDGFTPFPGKLIVGTAIAAIETSEARSAKSWRIGCAGKNCKRHATTM